MATLRSKQWVTCVPYISETRQVYTLDLLDEAWSSGRQRWGSVAPGRMREGCGFQGLVRSDAIS